MSDEQIFEEFKPPVIIQLSEDSDIDENLMVSQRFITRNELDEMSDEQKRASWIEYLNQFNDCEDEDEEQDLFESDSNINELDIQELENQESNIVNNFDESEIEPQIESETRFNEDWFKAFEKFYKEAFELKYPKLPLLSFKTEKSKAEAYKYFLSIEAKFFAFLGILKINEQIRHQLFEEFNPDIGIYCFKRYFEHSNREIENLIKKKADESKLQEYDEDLLLELLGKTYAERELFKRMSLSEKHEAWLENYDVLKLDKDSIDFIRKSGKDVHWSQLLGNPYRFQINSSMVLLDSENTQCETTRIKGMSKSEEPEFLNIIFDKSYVIEKIKRELIEPLTKQSEDLMGKPLEGLDGFQIRELVEEAYQDYFENGLKESETKKHQRIKKENGVEIKPRMGSKKRDKQAKYNDFLNSL